MPKPNSLIQRLFYYAAKNPTHEALVTSTFKLSYAQLAQLVRVQVKNFSDAGIDGEAVIGIKCTDDPQHLLMCLAATHMGATSCTIPSHEAQHIQNEIINRCGVTHVIEENIAVDPMSLDIITQSTPDELAVAQLLFSTSGTTGEPKIVVLQDNDLVAQAHRHVNSDEERFVCLASMEHNFVKRHRLYCVAMGATNVFVDARQESLVSQCQSLNVNVMHVSAFQAQELLATPDISKLSDIRLKLGGSHVPLSLRQQLRDNITQRMQAGYGTTETGAIAFTDPEDLNAAESVGRALPGIEVRAVSPAGKILEAEEHGELAVSCHGMFQGYLGNTDLTASRLKDGWFYTGDIGYLDQQQRIHLSGRSDDMFVFNSINIYPQDIESQIRQHPEVTDAVVLPIHSPVHGNIPVSLIVITNNSKPDLLALKKFVKQRVGIRSPRQIYVVDEIPRNASGKISRGEAIKLFSKGKEIRGSIAQVLREDVSNLNPSLVTAFENGDQDITLKNIEMDSLARMDLLIALETGFDTIIHPQEFAQFRSLEDIVSRALSSSSGDELNQSPNTPINATSNIDADNLPYLIKFFRRIYSFCHTATQLNKALKTLEQRLTPLEVEYLNEWHVSGHLIPSSAATKFQTALNNWLHSMKIMMMASGKNDPEPFVSHRIAPTVTHFSGSGSSANKTLLICFSMGGERRLMMPNAVLMQHTDSRRYDLLIVSEPLHEAYRLGVPLLGENVTAITEWLSRLDLVSKYRGIRTMGTSAGGYPAVLAGYHLGAEIAVSVAGRFHSERYPIRILDRVFTTWRAVSKGHCERVLMSYADDKSRDRIYAKVIAGLSGGNLVAVEFTEGNLGHHFLTRLLERGELTPFLAKTIFAEKSDPLIATDNTNWIMSFPANKIRPYGKPG